MSDTETLTVIVEREIPYPPEKLWRALTQPHLLAEWLMENDFKPVVGHRFNLRNNPKPDVNIVIDCQVMEIEPLKTLSYSWGAFGVGSIVTWTLTPTGTGTHLRMEQTGFKPDRPQNYHGARAGWPKFLAKLEQVLARME
jgi:uncharacterized protein YndB with AHSA1/START domain